MIVKKCFLLLLVLFTGFLFAEIKMSDYRDYLDSNVSVVWDEYPYYTAYEKIMEKWANDYPQICKLFDLGPTVRDRKILVIKVSDNVDRNEAEPRFIQVASLHGDELLNYMITLHVIDTLLSSYGIDDTITGLINNIEFWFCPLANPDGTYSGGDSTTITSCRRYNAHNRDLDGNWSCLCSNPYHLDYGIYDSEEPEVTALMRLHGLYRFNLHLVMDCGTEALVWPYGAVGERPCDEKWFEWAAKRYAVQANSNSDRPYYMTSCGGDGAGHMFNEFYEVHGTRLDFCSRFANLKGFILYDYMIKMFPGDKELRDYWRYNKRALLQFYGLLFTGVQGVVTDATTKKPVYNVKITADGYDFDSAYVFTDSAGYYLRFIEIGNYSFTFSHPSYQDTTIPNVSISDYEDKITLNVELKNTVGIGTTNSFDKQLISIIPVRNSIKIVFNDELSDKAKVGIYTINGKKIKSFPIVKKSLTWDGRDSSGNKVSNGSYFVQLQAGSKKYCRSFMFIH